MNFEHTKYKSEQGAVLPVFAVMLGSIIAVMFALYLNSVMVSRNSNLFRSVAKNICRNIADSNLYTTHQSMASAFAYNLKSAFSHSHPVFGYDKFKLKKALLLLPVMPNAGVSFNYNATFTPDSASLGSGTFAANNIDPNCTSGVNWATGGDSDCKIEINLTNVAVTDKVPTGAMSTTQNASNTIGCYLEGEFNGFKFDLVMGGSDTSWGDKIPVVANYTFWRPLRGNFDLHNTSDPKYDYAPGLVLAIATQATTYSNLAQNNWSQMNDVLALDAYSPIFDGANLLSPANTLVSYETAFSSVPTENDPRPVPSASGTTVTNFPGALSGTNAGASPLGASDFYEMLLACSNPFTLVRNMFASTFLQLASRHTHLRSSTEVLHVSTQHRDTIDGSDVNAISAEMNPPVQVVGLGTDLLTSYDNLAGATKAFQIPYIYYHAGDGGSVLANNFGHAKGGRINPMTDVAGWGSHHAVVANQLRACAHLYRTGKSVGPELIKVPHANFYENNSFFESVDYTDYIDSEGYSTQSPFYSMEHFDQNCPFGSGEASCTSLTVTRGSQPNTSITGVDAATLVGMFGTTQSCPYYQANANFATSSRCDKPDDDIRPDIRAVVAYVTAVGQATLSPGIFPFTKGGPNPFATTNYVNIKNQSLPLVIITHKGLRTAEATAIAGLIVDQTRPITIFFMPTNRKELGLADNFKIAFKLDDTSFKNRLFVLDPRELLLKDKDGIRINYCSSESIGDCDDDDFADYFADLISPGSSGRSIRLAAEHSIINRARYILNEFTGNVAKKY